MKQTFLFVRPPRPLWPFNGPGSAFWPPLAFASMAAALRDHLRDLNVAILDAPALRMGWKSVAAELSRIRPDYVGIGEEAVSAREGLRLAKLAKDVGAKVVAGGCFFSHVAPHVLRTGLVDVVVHGEGEQTVVELIAAWQGGSSLDKVAGMSFMLDAHVVRTAERPLIADLNSLPFPAYDLLPIERYGRESRNHPALAAIELSRGCAHECEFCVLWRQMAKTNGSGLRPHLRVKSSDRATEEVDLLVHHYGRRYLGWVDPCFNAHPTIPAEVSQRLLLRGIKVGQSAWVRSDCLLRDHRSGALQLCVDAGLNEIYIGVERLADAELEAISKGSDSHTTFEALKTVPQHYPQVTVVGSVIYGLPSDTPESLRRIFRSVYELPLDIVFFIPLTPLPGSPLWSESLWDDSLANVSRMNFLPEIKNDDHIDGLTRALYRAAIFDAPLLRARRVYESLTSSDKRRRSVYLRYWSRLVPFVLRGFCSSFTSGSSMMRLPSWYES